MRLLPVQAWQKTKQAVPGTKEHAATTGTATGMGHAGTTGGRTYQ